MIVIIVIIIMILLMLSAFIVGILFLYQRKQASYQHSLKNLKAEYENIILKTQLEIQEQTFQTISREIHDNINLNLTLVKLKLNTLIKNDLKDIESINFSINLLGTSISDLADISRTLSSEIISEQGLIRALELEIKKIDSIAKQKMNFNVYGTPVFMDSKKELILFRVVQESFNNIIKHSRATNIYLEITYTESDCLIAVIDDGIGFDIVAVETEKGRKYSSGLRNIKNRIALINGKVSIETLKNQGTKIKMIIPLHE